MPRRFLVDLLADKGRTTVSGTLLHPDRFNDKTNIARQAVEAHTSKWQVFSVRGSSAPLNVCRGSRRLRESQVGAM